jgi:hypothetical protein
MRLSRKIAKDETTAFHGDTEEKKSLSASFKYDFESGMYKKKPAEKSFSVRSTSAGSLEL